MSYSDKPSLRDAITALTNEKWSHYKGGDASTIGWDNPEKAPSIAELNSKLSELTTEWESKQYQRDRAVEYPSINDQLDEIFHKGLTEWKKTIQAVKDKHPKPTE